MISTAFLVLLALSVAHGTPLPNNFNCPEAAKELQLFRALLEHDTTNDISSTIRVALYYFNVSQIYHPPLVEKVTSFCKVKP